MEKQSGAALHYKGNVAIYTIGLEILIFIILEYHWTDVQQKPISPNNKLEKKKKKNNQKTWKKRHTK